VTSTPVSFAHEPLARLAGAAVNRGGRLALLPDGSARAERLRELQVGPHEPRLRVALYALTGLDIEPRYVWLRDDGDPGLFAWTYPGWLDLIADGTNPTWRGSSRFRTRPPARSWSSWRGA
jgi:hypothetical protein